MYYTGKYDVRLDAKNRLRFPSVLRNKFDKEIHVMIGFDDFCIEVHDKNSFEEKAKAINQGSEFDSNSRQVKRALFSNTFTREFDSIGRIVIPEKLLSRFSGSNELVIIGVGKNLEIWSQQKLEESLNNTITNMGNITKQLHKGNKNEK